MSVFKSEDRDAVRAGMTSFTVIAMTFAFAALLVSVHADNRKSGVPAGAVQVTLSEFAISPSTIPVPLSGTIVVANAGTTVHNFNLQGTKIHTKDILTHAEGPNGMFGMVTTFIVEPK
jgi:hypothetical protein